MASIEQNTPISNLTLIKDITAMAKNIECEIIVLQNEGEPTRTRDGEFITKLWVADKTGSIILSVWGQNGLDIRFGDILHVTGLDGKLRKGQLILTTRKEFKMTRIGQDTFPFSERPNLSEIDFSSVEMQHSNNSNNRSRNQSQAQQAQSTMRIPNNNNNTNFNRNNHSQHQHKRGNIQNIGFYNNRGGGGRGRGRGGNNTNRYHHDMNN
ncbi:MAG: hypothetical protein EXX96DRAFT_578357 [Benjaminiella poitrasii]|nr:MAG: hypothetical protein EXX96DRAFT_578357 [Benjaminiella poitrasii]